MPENDEFYKQPMFYAIYHFSKFVPRDSYRILSAGLEDNQNVKAIAFLTPNQQIVIVAVNKLVKNIFISYSNHIMITFFRKIYSDLLFLIKLEINF